MDRLSEKMEPASIFLIVTDPEEPSKVGRVVPTVAPWRCRVTEM